MRVLELGNYIVPAFAGMILAEQGHEVTKWTNGRDPILGLRRGDELWDWINYGKQIEKCHPTEIHALVHSHQSPDIIIDNFRPSTLEKWHIDPAFIAERHRIVWVSARSEVGEISFDLIAQCRSWMEYTPWVPFYVGDTVTGLWLAFKALAALTAGKPGHYSIGHASCLQKLVEGELVIDVERNGKCIPWDIDEYTFRDGEASILYRGERYVEPVRDRQWKLTHLWHRDGRIII